MLGLQSYFHSIVVANEFSLLGLIQLSASDGGERYQDLNMQLMMPAVQHVANKEHNSNHLLSGIRWCGRPVHNF